MPQNDVPIPSIVRDGRYSDAEGRLSPEAERFFQQLIAKIADLEGRVAELEGKEDG